MAEKKSKTSKAHLEKEKLTRELAEQIKNARTLMIVSIKSLPSRQFQAIKKSIRDKALVRVIKKNIMLRTIKSLGKESILPLEKYVKENSAFIISNIEGFELAGILNQKRNSVFAKAGQTAPMDIEVKEGPTNLPPGPAISEFSALGIQIAVEEGKIAVRASKVLVQEGKLIKEDVAALIKKLNIQPFSVGLEPIVIYDVQKEKIYSNIKIDPESVRKELIEASLKAKGFAQKIVYYCKETIVYFLAKANSESESLKRLTIEENQVQLNNQEETS